MEGFRPLRGVQRAYFYLVALVAVHMVVLAIANLLRVAVEIAFHAPPGGFTGLPFVFADLNQPEQVYRQQASLAIALLVVGLPAWYIHFGYAQRIAKRAPEDRASGWRSFHIHVVILVTALLVYGYGQRTLRLVLQGTMFSPSPGRFFGLEPEWGARAAGAGLMALTAAAVLAYHVWISNGDRRATVVAGRAAMFRQLTYYALVAIGLLGAATSAIIALNQVWTFVADQAAPPQGLRGFSPPNSPTELDSLRFNLIAQLPAMLAGLALWLGTWIPLQRRLRAPTADGDVERHSVVRKLAIYLIVLVSAVTFLVSGTMALASIGRRILGDRVIEEYSTLYREIGAPLITAIVFGAVWIFHRRVIAAEAAREAEQECAANIRRSYTYLVAALGLTMLAIGTAGLVGVIGSKAMGIDTHSNGETATYGAVVVLGAPAWAYAWWQTKRGLTDEERRSLPRRVYLYLAAGGGVVAFLVFLSAVLYRFLNAALGGQFTLPVWHDGWHFTVDAAVSAGAFIFHLAIIRAERGAQAVGAAVSSDHPLTVVVRAIDAAAARARLAAALEGQADMSIR